MATQEDIDRISEAMTKAHAMGRMDDARVLAAEYKRLTAGVASPEATETAAPERGLAGQVSDSMVGDLTAAKAMAQGLPFVGKWSDEAAGWLSSKIHGGDAEQARKDWMAPVEAMPAGRRMAAELAGGAVGSGVLALAAPAAFATVPAALATGVAEGAVSGAGANAENRGMGTIAGAGLGAVGGVLGTAGAGIISNLGRRVANAVRGAAGAPVSPFVGKGGAAAQKTLRESVENAAARGEAAPVTDVPLIAQPAGTAAAKRVLAGGGENAARVAGVAREQSEAASEELARAGAGLTDIGHGLEVQSGAGVSSLSRKLGMAAKLAEGKGAGALSAAEKQIADTGASLTAAGREKIAAAAAKLAGEARDVGAAGVKTAGKKYQDLGIVPLSATTTAEDVARGRVVNSPRLVELLDNEDVKSVLAEQSKDLLWENIPRLNINRLHALKGDLAARAREATGSMAGRLSRINRAFGDALDEAIPGYGEAARNYRESIGLKTAFDLGYGFDTKKITREMLDALPPDERAEVISAMGQRFVDLTSPVGGESMPAAQMRALTDRLKRRIALSFGKDADGFVRDVISGAQQIRAGEAAAAAARRGVDVGKVKKLRESLAPVLGEGKPLDDFIDSVSKGRAAVDAGKKAGRLAERGLDRVDLAASRAKLAAAFGDMEKADEFVSSVVDLLGKKEAGKFIKEAASKIAAGGVVDPRVVGSVAGDEAAALASGAKEAARRKALADTAGGASTYTPLEGGFSESFGRFLAESTSGSLPGVEHRAAFNLAALIARTSGRAAGKAEAKRLAAILAEKDPEKIAMAIRMLKQDLTGRSLRPFLVPQFDDTVHGMLRD